MPGLFEKKNTKKAKVEPSYIFMSWCVLSAGVSDFSPHALLSTWTIQLQEMHGAMTNSKLMPANNSSSQLSSLHYITGQDMANA